MSTDEKASAIIKHGTANDLEALVKEYPEKLNSYIVWAAAAGKMPHVLALHALYPGHFALQETAYEAAKNGHNDIVLFILDNNDVYAQDNVLAIAAENKNHELLDAVLERDIVHDHFPAVEAAILATDWDTAIKLINVMKKLDEHESYALRWA